jgi:hypothetical protein
MAKNLYKQSKFLGHRNGTSAEKKFSKIQFCGSSNSVAKFSLACPAAGQGRFEAKLR